MATTIEKGWQLKNTGALVYPTQKLYCSGDVIPPWGEHPYCYRVVSGLMGLRVGSKFGQYGYAGIMGKGELFGEEVFEEGKEARRAHTAIALSETVVRREPVDKWISAELARHMLKRSNELLELFLMKNSSERIAYIQERLSGVKVSHALFGELIWKTRVCVSQNIKKG